MIRIVSFLILLSAISMNTSGQSRSEITSLLSDLEKVIEEEHMPGLMLSIVKRDGIVYSGGLGYADLEKKIKVDSSTLFHLASVTKFFTATGIYGLIAEGKLNLNDRLQDLAPEVDYTNPWEATNPVRLIHLLEHTAGFEDVQINKMIITDGKPLEGLSAVNFMRNSLTSRWKPGERMSYSNPGYVVLGYIIEKFSGKPWNIYLHDRLLTPLKMHSTAFNLDGKYKAGYAKGYNFKSGKQDFLPFHIPGGNGADQALVSNASDMSKLLYSLLNNFKTDSGEILGPDYVNKMEKVHSTLAAERGLETGYASGNDLSPSEKKITFRGHNGKGEGFCSWLFYNREAGLGYVISVNGNHNLWRISERIEALLTKDLAYPIPDSDTSGLQQFSSYAGYYQFTNPKNEQWQFYSRIFSGIRVSFSHDRMIIDKGRGNTDSLIHCGQGIFRQKKDIIPSFIIARDHEGNAFLQGYGKSFYQKRSYFPIGLQKFIISGGLVSALIFLILAFISLVLYLFGKLRKPDLPLTVLPACGVLLGIMAFRLVSITDEASKELFSSINSTTLGIFFGSLCFCLFTFWGGFWFFRRYVYLHNRWFKVTLIFCYAFLSYLVFWLMWNGLIGVRIWTL
jgi:CubicO group peptidase (beta-lactamase class C family)